MHAHLRNDPSRTFDHAALLREGILVETLGLEHAEPVLHRLQHDDGFSTRDEVQLTPDTPNLTNILKSFDGEHRHSEDEIRFILAGAGVFDIRTLNDEMVRITVTPGDLIVVPKARFHRFELTAESRIHAVRLFRDKSGWVPDYRSDAIAKHGA